MDDDRTLLEKRDPPFGDITMFTCTYEVRLGNINRTHQDLIEALEPRGAIKAINCNFGHKAQPGYERFIKHPRPEEDGKDKPRKDKPRKDGKDKPRKDRKDRKDQPAAQGKVAPAVTRKRRVQGDGTCFNSCLEVTIIPGPDDNPPPELRELFDANPGKYYAVKSFPTTGVTQVPGVLQADLGDGTFAAHLWAKFLSESGVGTIPEEPVSVITERPIMINCKFELHRSSDRIILGLANIIDHLTQVKETGGELPYPIRELKDAQDGQNISFKFETPPAGVGLPTKKVRVNMFYRGKVNILGAVDIDCPHRIYRYLSDLILERWNDFVVLKPLPDRAVARRATTRAKPKADAPKKMPPVPPARVVVGQDNIITDDDLDSLLDDNTETPGDDNTEVPDDGKAEDLGIPVPRDPNFLLALVQDFGAYGEDPDLDEVPVDHVDGEYEEYH